MQIKKIQFVHYKAFRNFTVNLSDFDVLVGPNNAGKSTILGAFRILSEGLKKANTRRAELIEGPNGRAWGYSLDLGGIPVSLENVFYDYDESRPATITFFLENNHRCVLYFPERGVCFLVPEGAGIVNTPTIFKKDFPIDVRFVPVLGPVEHEEEIYNKETARRALLTHRASRNFRNIWYNFPDGFTEFKEMIRSTWPGMDIDQPVVMSRDDKQMLAMFCPEERIPREIYWAGFGFQVWCQMLTFILQARGSSMLVIDEPDIYLHSDLQRQLVGILRDLNLQVIIATHSVEIITEVDPVSLLTIHKKRQSATRISNSRELQNIYQLLGSNANPTLTQLAKTHRALFLEGQKDFQLLSLFAKKLNYNKVSMRSDFAVIPVDGFNPQKVKDFSSGIEVTLGEQIHKGVIFDRDYRSNEEVAYLEKELKKTCQLVIIHKRKEIENFLLNPTVLDRAMKSSIEKRGALKGAKHGKTLRSAAEILTKIANEFRTYALAQFLSKRREYVRKTSQSTDHDATIDNFGLQKFDDEWQTLEGKLRIIPGKEALSKFNQIIQCEYGFSLTPHAIINSFEAKEIDAELTQLVTSLAKFAESKIA